LTKKKSCVSGMAPAALAIPQYINNPTRSSTNTTKIRSNESSEWNMESALDFDLLAEYLLEDVGAGGFDFSNPNAVSPPTLLGHDAKQPAVSSLPLQDHAGIVTPNGSTSFVDPLANFAAQLQQQQPVAAQQQQVTMMPQPMQVSTVAAAALPMGGDMTGELNHVQEMIVKTQQQAVAVAVAPPVVPLAPNPIQQRTTSQIISRPLVVSNHAPNTMAVRQNQLPAAVAGRGPIPPMSVNRAILSKAPLPMAQQPPHKRPRVTSVTPSSKGSSYSFSSVSAAARTNPASSLTSPTNRQKSQAQLDRRRERNRILARRTRLRKKFFFESLQKDVADLQRENAALKSIVRSRLKPADATVLLEQCNANEKLPSSIHARDIEGMASSERSAAGGAAEGAQTLDKEDFSLIQSIQNSQQCFIITDPSLHDNPIVYASNDFLTLTGYSQEEVLGRNCRFLQGTDTCPEKVGQIRKAVGVGEDVNVTFVNYTSDGEPFWNSLFIAALRDADNNIVNFIGVIVKVTGPEVGDSEYGKVLK